jgi:Protein of unknown function (DUF4058)
MLSPFPGMDPYIEHPEVWSDFHGALAEVIRSQLNEVIRPRYVARMTPLPLRLYTVEIRQVETMKLVTALEILSPVNKNPAHEAYDAYLRKRQELLRSQAHLIEIDLLRGGTRPPLQTPVPEAPYYITVSRANKRPYVEVWPIQLPDVLPVLPIPLLEPDPDAPLDLGRAVAACYERGGYEIIIDYTRNTPPPKLTKADALWLDERLRQAGLR